MKRAIDIILSIILLILLSPVMILVTLAVRLTSRGAALHLSKRFGRDSRIFIMPKYRSMRIDTPQLPTHLLQNGATYLTPIGGFLRNTSLDELPQIWSVLKGDMSLVGPRPALFNQDDLMQLRREAGVDRLRPGITGWAQINGRDELAIPEKVALEAEYMRRQSLIFDMRILFLTAMRVFRRQGISH